MGQDEEMSRRVSPDGSKQQDQRHEQQQERAHEQEHFRVYGRDVLLFSFFFIFYVCMVNETAYGMCSQAVWEMPPLVFAPEWLVRVTQVTGLFTKRSPVWTQWHIVAKFEQEGFYRELNRSDTFRINPHGHHTRLWNFMGKTHFIRSSCHDVVRLLSLARERHVELHHRHGEPRITEVMLVGAVWLSDDADDNRRFIQRATGPWSAPPLWSFEPNKRTAHARILVDPENGAVKERHLSQMYFGRCNATAEAIDIPVVIDEDPANRMSLSQFVQQQKARGVRQ